MGFNAGGTNVGGVQQVESGILTLDSNTSTMSGTGTITENFTVPTGKKWTLKNFGQFTVGAWTGTITAGYGKIIKGGQEIIICKDSTTIIGGDAGKIGSENITLEAGDIFRSQIVVTAYTSGDLKANLLYQEITV